MACFHPLSAFQTLDGQIVFDRPSLPAKVLSLPCGRCIGCKVQRTQDWAMRCVHEAKSFQNNCFITLTYDDEHLPSSYVSEGGYLSGSLNPVDFTLFMKRLRRRFQGLEPVPDSSAKNPYQIRYYQCGEYGERTHRPHHHACIFNFVFPDLVRTGSRNGNDYYESEILNELWGKGRCIIGELTADSAGYVARYCQKKITGSISAEHYHRVDQRDGRLIQLVPEYATMSRRPGIGAYWFSKYHTDVYPLDRVVMTGARLKKPPRFYDKMLKRKDEHFFRDLKARRVARAALSKEHNTPYHLAASETMLLAKLKMRKDSL